MQWVIALIAIILFVFFHRKGTALRKEREQITIRLQQIRAEYAGKHGLENAIGVWDTPEFDQLQGEMSALNAVHERHFKSQIITTVFVFIIFTLAAATTGVYKQLAKDNPSSSQLTELQELRDALDNIETLPYGQLKETITNLSGMISKQIDLLASKQLEYERIQKMAKDEELRRDNAKNVADKLSSNNADLIKATAGALSGDSYNVLWWNRLMDGIVGGLVAISLNQVVYFGLKKWHPAIAEKVRIG